MKEKKKKREKKGWEYFDIVEMFFLIWDLFKVVVLYIPRAIGWIFRLIFKLLD